MLVASFLCVTLRPRPKYQNGLEKGVKTDTGQLSRPTSSGISREDLLDHKTQENEGVMDVQ